MIQDSDFFKDQPTNIGWPFRFQIKELLCLISPAQQFFCFCGICK